MLVFYKLLHSGLLSFVLSLAMVWQPVCGLYAVVKRCAIRSTYTIL